MPVYETLNWMPSEIYGIPSLYWILIFAAGIIVVLTLLFIGYFIIYKIRINKAIAEEKHIGKPLLTPLSMVSIGFVVLWIASTVFIIAMLHLISSFSAQNSYYICENYRNIISMRQELMQDKITEDYTFTVGEINAKEKTAELTVDLFTDITLGKDDKLTFRIGDSEAQLKLNSDGRYTGTVNASIWKDYPSGILTLETDGVKITQILSSRSLIFTNYTEWPETIGGNEWAACYPYVEFDTSNVKISEEGDKTKLDGSIKVIAFPAEEDQSIKFTELTLVLALDGKTFRQVDLMNDKGVYQQDINYTYTLNDTVGKGEITYYVLAKDGEGNNYRLYNDTSYFLSANGYEPIGDVDEDAVYSDPDGKYSMITDKDGNVIKKFLYT